MDVKYVLSSILREASNLGAVGELLAGVRLSGAVNGDRGEGYLLLYADGMALLYRKLGQRDYEGCFSPLTDWRFDNYREEKYALALDVHCLEQCYRCEFTPSERDSAEKLLNALSAAHAEPQALFDEKTLLMAALFIKYCDQNSQAYVKDLMGKQLYHAAVKYASARELEAMIRLANENFSEEQKRSVLLNLIEMFMSDDLWTSRESAAMRELALEWKLPEEVYKEYAMTLLLRRSLGNLFQS